MKVLGLVFLALIATSFCEDDEFPLEKDFMIFIDSTFDKAVEKYEYLLVYSIPHGVVIENIPPRI